MRTSHNALTLGPARKRFLLNVERDRLKGGPGFDKGHWPDRADKTWTQQIHACFGTKPSMDIAGS